jgi:hypothetical protein
MGSDFRHAVPIVLAALATLTVAASAVAQMPRGTVDATPQTTAMPDEPSFRDPKTGQVWTPANVGLRGGPDTPADRAFDPHAQDVVVQGVVQEQVEPKLIGSVPITAGPTVPLVQIDSPALRAIPGGRWRVVLYMSNNSASTFSPVVECQFKNGQRVVQRTQGLLPPTAGGQRVGFTLWGPRSRNFVDSVHCHIVSP